MHTICSPFLIELGSMVEAQVYALRKQLQIIEIGYFSRLFCIFYIYLLFLTEKR